MLPITSIVILNIICIILKYIRLKNMKKRDKYNVHILYFISFSMIIFSLYLIYIAKKQQDSAFIIFTIIFALMGILCLWENIKVVGDDLTIRRMFKKTKKYKFSDFTSYGKLSGGIGFYIKIGDKKVCDIAEIYCANVEQLEADLDRWNIPYKENDPKESESLPLVKLKNSIDKLHDRRNIAREKEKQRDKMMEEEKRRKKMNL